MPKLRSSRERSAFGQRMFDAREAAGLTQMDVRAQIGCSQGTLSQLEGMSESSGLVSQFAELYRVSAKWLATGDGPREAPPPPLPPTNADRAIMLREMMEWAAVLPADEFRSVYQGLKNAHESALPPSVEPGVDQGQQPEASRAGIRPRSQRV